MSNCDNASVPPAEDVIRLDDANADLRSAPDETLTIANVARMFDVSRLTLRYYEGRGLIKRRHRIGRLRVYTWADCNRIAFIIKCRRVGLGLGEVAPLLRASDVDASAESVRGGRAKCLELIDRLDQRRRPLREALAELRHLNALLSTRLNGSDESDRGA
jgi:DNA-binding transcriptional MerR regulator